MNGLRSCHQNRGSRQAPSPGPTRLPSKKLADSIRSGSVSTARPCLAAMGAAVSWARCSGEAITATMSRSASAVGHRGRLRAALVGQVESGQPAVEDAARVVHLAVAHDVHPGVLGHQDFPSSAARGGPGRGGQGVGDPVERAVVQRRRDEPRLEGAARRVDARVQQRMEERRIAPRLAGPRGREIGHRRLGEEHAEHVAGPRNLVRHTGIRQRVGEQPGQAIGVGVQRA